jgi:transcriptional regulator
VVYVPSHFKETDVSRLHALIADFPLATLVTSGQDGIAANHIPLILDLSAGEHGTLIGHVARNNDLWRDGRHDGESLAVFQSADAYISPNWYAAKQETHEVVPTWNYAVVHVYGSIVVHDDEKWVRGAVGRLTKKMEALQSDPWKMADAPASYLAGMLANIVGIEMPISRISGKWKVSQNRPLADRSGAVEGLRLADDPGAEAMARLIESGGSS